MRQVLSKEEIYLNHGTKILAMFFEPFANIRLGVESLDRV
jgi:hypothetical protein